MIDELAVDAAVQGYPQKLSRDEQAEALRRMGNKYPMDIAAWLVGAPNTKMCHRLKTGNFK